MRTSYSRRELYAFGEPLGDSATYLKADGGLILGDGGGGGGGSQPASSTTQTQDLPDWAKPYAQDVLSKGKAVTDLDQNPYQPYGGDRIAGFDPMQQQSFQGAQNMKVAPQIGQATAAATGAGLGGFDVAGQSNQYGFQNQVGGYMNPYLQMSLAPQIAEANRAYDISGTRQQSAATQAGAFGGSREAIMAAENERNRNMGINQIVGQGYNTAFTNAQNQYNQNLQNQLAGYGMANQAAGQLGNLGQTQYQQNMGINALQNQYGAQQQAQQQRGLDTAYQDFLTQKNYPYQQLSYMSNLVRGTPMGMNTQSQVYQAPPSTMGQLAGLGMGAYGLSKMAAGGGLMDSYAGGGEVKGYAGGGDIPDPMNDSYEMAAAVDKLTDEQLQGILQHPSSPAEFRAAQDEMAMRASEQRGIASGITPGMANRMAGGGIVAFKDRGYVEGATGDELERLQAQTASYIEGAKLAAEGRDIPESFEIPISSAVDPDSEARFTTPSRSTPLSRAGESITSGLKSVGSSISSALKPKPIPGMKFDSEDSALEENVRLANIQKQKGSGSTLNAVPVSDKTAKTPLIPLDTPPPGTTTTKKESLPSGAKTPAEYDKDLAGRKDLTKEQRDSMSGMYRNGYAQFEKSKVTKPSVATGATRPAGSTASKEPSFIDDLKTAQSFLRDPESEARARKVEASIEALKKQPDEIKKQGLANLLTVGGFGMAQAASQPGAQRGLAGVIQSAAKAGPAVAQAAMDQQKLMRASQENAAKLDIEYQKYRIAESKGDKQAMISAGSNIRMMRQQQMQLDEAKRHNIATEGIQGQSLSLQQKKLEANAAAHERYAMQTKANIWTNSMKEASKNWLMLPPAEKKRLGTPKAYAEELYNQGWSQAMPQLNYMGTLGKE
jgi:hypothetical protein